MYARIVATLTFVAFVHNSEPIDEILSSGSVVIIFGKLVYV